MDPSVVELAVASSKRKLNEGFSEDPRITRAYGYEAVRGLQGGEARSGGNAVGVLATAKHFIGDGGTDGGKDQGVNSSSENTMGRHGCRRGALLRSDLAT
jgi:beta-glucosidase-like glycosyl hydrolase